MRPCEKAARRRLIDRDDIARRHVGHLPFSIPKS
jgi:hypothetical protein